MATNGLSMKLLIDTKAQRVCFAEAGSDVFEFFSCLLCLPMSTAINLLTKEHMVGSIGNVLTSVQGALPEPGRRTHRALPFAAAARSWMRR
ncbi:unnamed protein product [Urochloa humidicola]